MADAIPAAMFPPSPKPTVPNHLTPAVHINLNTGCRSTSARPSPSKAIERVAAVIDLDTLPSTPQTPTDSPEAYELLRQAAIERGAITDADWPERIGWTRAAGFAIQW